MATETTKTSEKVGSIKLPTFDGEPKKFQVRWYRFNAYATMYGFKKALTETGKELPKTEEEELDTTKEAGKTMLAAKKQNQKAMANFAMAFTGESIMGLMWAASTKEWPNGLAHLVVKGLMKRYRPLDTHLRVRF